MICPICEKREATNWDHDHATDLIRGRLCRRCNTAIGSLDEDPETLQRAIIYLRSPPSDLRFSDVKREQMRLTMRRWRAENRDLERQRKRDAYAADPERFRAYTWQWHKNDADGEKKRRRADQHRLWLAERPEKIVEYNRNRRDKRAKENTA